MKLNLILLAISAFAEEPKAAPQQIDAVRIMRMQALEQQATILRLEVCSEAGIHHTECIVDWRSGTVSKAPSAPPAPKAEPTK